LSLVWGHSFLFIKIAVSVLPPLWVVTARLAIGGGLLATVAAAMRSGADRRSLPWLGFVGLTGAALPWAGQAWAQQFLDSGLVSVLNSSTPIMTLAVAVMAGQEHLHRNRIVGLAIAVLGTLIIIRGQVGSGRSLLALLVAILSTLGYAVSAVVARARISGRVAPLPAAAVQLCFGALMLGPIAWATAGVPSAPPPISAIAALVALGVFGTGAAFVAYFALLERVGATNTSMVTYFAPVVGLMSGAYFRGERFGPFVFVGAATLVCGVWLAQRRP